MSSRLLFQPPHGLSESNPFFRLERDKLDAEELPPRPTDNRLVDAEWRLKIREVDAEFEHGPRKRIGGRFNPASTH